MTPEDWEFIGSAAGCGFVITFILMILDGLYNLICWWIYRKKKTSQQCSNTNREDDRLHCHNKRESA